MVATRHMWLFSILNIICLYFWLYLFFVAVHGLSLVVESGGYSLVVVLGLLVEVASLVVVPRL